MNRYKGYLIGAIALLVGFFFAYKGLTKHWLKPCKVFSPETTIPIEYINFITSLCQSGFLKMVGAMQILFGLLLFIPKTRLVGAIFLTPIVIVIFSAHLFMDNRPEELLETGLPLVGLILVLIYDIQRKIGWAAWWK
jgi:putative oxidoreductase